VEQTVARDDKEKWVPVQPPDGQVKEDVVEDALFFVANLRAVRIESHNARDLAPYGLSRSETTLTLGLSGAEGIQKSILVGASAGPDGRYAMIQGQDLVFVLENGVADRLTRDPVVFSKPRKVTGEVQATETLEVPKETAPEPSR